MTTRETILAELEDRFAEVPVGKTHLSVRYESGPRIARVGACLARYEWDTRMEAIKTMLDFEHAHSDEFAVEFDVVPLDAVVDENFAEA